MYIYKVIISHQEPDNIERINIITGLNVFNTDNWCDLGQFKDTPELKKFITYEEFKALNEREANYIASRIDC